MHRYAAARLNLTSATELSALNTAGQVWVHSSLRVGYHDNFQTMVEEPGVWGDFSPMVQNNWGGGGGGGP